MPGGEEKKMDDTTFYGALFRCYRPNEEQPPNCRYCPLLLKTPNDECRRMLDDEIRRRKCEALRKGRR